MMIMWFKSKFIMRFKSKKLQFLYLGESIKIKADEDYAPLVITHGNNSEYYLPVEI